MRPSDRARRAKRSRRGHHRVVSRRRLDVGLVGSQAHGALDWYGREGKNFTSDDDLFRAFAHAAPQIGIESHQASMVGGMVLDAAAAGTGGPPYVPQPQAMSRDEAMRERATILQSMRENRHAYDKDLDMQDRLHAAIEALGGDVSGHYQAPVPATSEARGARAAEIRGMMKDRSGPYYQGPQAAPFNLSTET